jgi:hypothetical protein
MTNNRRNPTGAALASLAAAAGLLVGLRSIASFELPRPATLLGIEPMAREGLGVLWSGQAAWPAEFQAVGLERLVQVLVLGADDLPREALYLSALQKPMHSGQLLLRGEQSAVDAVYGQMALGGFSPGEPRTLTQFRAGETVVLPWIRMVAVILSGVVLLLAMHGVHVTALKLTRRRWRELAIRRAVGAGRGRVIAHVVGEHVRVGLWGVAGMVFWGTMVVAFLRKAAGMDALGPLPYVVIGGWLVVLAVASSTAAVREARAVEPGAVVD